MPRIELDTSLRDLLGFFRAKTRIYGRCPHCGLTFRLSEVKLTYGQEPPRDLLTRLQRERDQLHERIDQLDARLADQAADFERELDEVRLTAELQREAEVQKRLQNEIGQIRARAIAGAKATRLGQALERVSPLLAGFGHHPADVHPVFAGVDLLALDGAFIGNLSEIALIEIKVGTARLSPLQRSIRDCVEHGRVRFEVLQISAATLRRILARRPPCGPIVELRAPRGRNGEAGAEPGDGHA